MDKQFINIDDLVRQRLSGSEEEERSGAWRNMRELLDNEMPQKRVGFFNWRRMFSGMAVLLLLGSISLGSYELSSSVRGTGAKGYATGGKNTVTPVMRAKGSASISSSDSRDNQSVAAYVAEGKPGQSSSMPAEASLNASDVNVPAANSLAANENASMTGADAANTTSNTSTGARNSQIINGSDNSTITHKNSYSNGHNNTLAAAVNTNNTSNIGTQTTGNQHIVNAGSPVASNTEGIRIASIAHNNNTSHLAGQVTGKKVNNTESTPAAGGEQMSSLPLAAASNVGNTTGRHRAKIYNVPAATSIAKKTSGNATSVEDATPGTSAPVSSNGTMALNSTKSTAGLLKAEKASRHHRTSNGHSTLATNTRVASILSKAAAAKNATKHSYVHTSHSSAASTVTALVKTENPTSAPLSSSTAATPAMAAKTSAIATGTAKVSVPKVHSSGSSVSASVIGHKPTASIAKAGSSAVPSKPVSEPVGDAAATEEHSNVKKIDKLTLVYREQYYQTTNVDGYYKMDTISLLRTGAPDPVKTAAKQNNGTGTSGNNNTNSNTGSNNNTTALAAAPVHGKTSTSAGNRNAANVDEQNEEPVADASANEPATTNASAATPATASTTDETAAASPAPAKKELNAAKKSAGSNTMDKLNEKFNDLKYHVKGVQFAPGLTAGINSTFFAPESFKGFQFGFTGEFVFSDAVSVMTELKYFHRINSNYALEDNYYKYTQVGGQYKKELQLNSYSFSTLHSVELPVAVRYTAGKFSFFAGGNFLYTFSINTGAVTLPGPTSATFVSAIGEDNAPKIAAQDFDSRFGVGYLFGASFQVSPNVFFDVRNAQTVWDNSGSAGAKYVSGQLYKNPSLQVSIGYRFGSKKSEE